MSKKTKTAGVVDELFASEDALTDAACDYASDPSYENREALRTAARRFGDAVIAAES